LEHILKAYPSHGIAGYFCYENVFISFMFNTIVKKEAIPNYIRPKRHRIVN
jgi:hypothetical protein